MGANVISWTTPAPVGDYLLGVYFRLFLEYFEKIFLKIFKFKKIHYYVMVYIIVYAKTILLSKKFESIYNSFYCLKTLVTNVSKMFLGTYFPFIRLIPKF
jgi:hypothetical protein